MAPARHCHIRAEQLPTGCDQPTGFTQGIPLRSTRRQFLLTASALVLAAALADLGLPGGQARAQSVAEAELMQPGPLGEVSMGDAKAPVTIIEYASMTCPHCAHFAINTFPALKEKYIDTGKVRFIFREFPFDPVAAGAFMLARCAGNDKFFAVVDLLFHTQREWAVEKPLQPLLKTVKQAGFTEESFKACLANQKMLDGIESIRQRAVDKFKVQSTPTFFINGTAYPGALEIDELSKLIDAQLKT